VTSDLSRHVADYLRLRRALGFKLVNEGVILPQFVAFLEQAGQSTVTAQTAIAWAQQPQGVNPINWVHRLVAVRGFAFNLEVDLLFFDTTSTYFERDEEEDGDDAFRRFGHSKDHRPDLPQIVIGLAVTKEGIPVRCWCWPGNSNDPQVLAEVRDDLRDWKLGRVITVVDRGFSSADNLAYLRRAGVHYIAGMRMRDGNPLVEQVLSRQGRYQQVKDNLRVKEVRLDASDTRFVICHNPEQAERDAAQRADAITRIQAELARIADQRHRDAKRPRGDKTRQRNEAAHVRAQCALRDHPTLGRWLTQQANGRLKANTAKVKAEARLDGKYLIATSDPHISTEDVALGYKNLLEAERGFRDLKTHLLLRPVFHRLEHRIRAHVLICWPNRVTCATRTLHAISSRSRLRTMSGSPR